MKHDYKNYVRSTIVVSALLLTSSLEAFAQGPPSPPGVPLDAGIIVLIIGCVLYGLKKIYQKK